MLQWVRAEHYATPDQPLYRTTGEAYRFEIQTSDIRRAGLRPGSSICLTLVGPTGVTAGPFTLGPAPRRSVPYFQRAALDVFEVDGVSQSLGRPGRLELWVNSRHGAKTSWHVDWIKIARLKDGAPPVHFPCHRWVEGSLSVTNLLSAEEPMLHRIGSQAVNEQTTGLEDQPLPGYQITFYTSRGCAAGTPSKVVLLWVITQSSWFAP